MAASISSAGEPDQKKNQRKWPKKVLLKLYLKRNEEEKGSTFWFNMVFTKQTGEQAIPEKKEIDLSKLRMLVVDYNRTNV